MKIYIDTSKFFNWSTSKKIPNQREFMRNRSAGASFLSFGFGITEFNLYSQVKDYRTDLLNGTNWTPVNPSDAYSLSYMQFLNLISRYSTAIFNDFNKVGFAVLANIEGQIFYIPQGRYTVNNEVVKVNGYPHAEVFTFDEPNYFCGEESIYRKCEPFQNLYNIALSCQKNGMSKSGYVTILSPKTPAGSNAVNSLTDTERQQLEKIISESHGVATDSQNNILLLNQEMNANTIQFDFAKMGILPTKQLCEEFVCSKLGVPYVLLPSSGQTFANYEQANDILIANHSRYCEYFTKFAKRELGFDIDYKTIEKTETSITQV